MEDIEYVEKMNAKLSDLYKESKDFINKALFLDYVKCETRGFSMSYSSYKAKQSKQKEMLLKSQLTELEDKISETPMSDIIDSYYDAKSALEALDMDKTTGSMIRSGVQCISENEKGTKYFLNLEK